MASANDRANNKPLIERRSIDYIPEVERHGRLLSQFTLWLGANLQITAIVTGALAVSLAASWQVAFGPYVADYSRYLPSNTSSLKAFLAAGAGSMIGAQVAMVLGVNVLGISIYVFGVLVQMPFISTHFYTGPLVASLGGTDISWIIGLVVPAALYYLCAKKWHGAVPEHLILPVEQAAPIEQKLNGTDRAATV